MRETKKQIMGGVENVVTSKLVENNTVEYTRTDGAEIIRLHHTDIITRLPDGSIVLDSGGWRTVTTKDRINRYTPYYVFQEKSVWYLSLSGRRFDQKRVFPYADGIRVYPDGCVEGQGPDPKRSLKLKKRVNIYVKGYVDYLISGEMSPPGNGDCWYCLMRTEDGRTLGDTWNSDHILGHFDEKYYVPALLTNAVEEIPVSRVTMSFIGYKWGLHDQDAGMFEDIARPQITKSLRRYLYRRVGLAS